MGEIVLAGDGSDWMEQLVFLPGFLSQGVKSFFSVRSSWCSAETHNRTWGNGALLLQAVEMLDDPFESETKVV